MTALEATIRRWIDQTSAEFPSVMAERWTSRLGRAMPSNIPTTAEYRQIVKAIKAVDVQPKACFQNSLNLALQLPNSRYCEGFGMLEGMFPVQHGWVLWHDCVIDVTWKLTVTRGLHAPRMVDVPVIGVYPPDQRAYTGIEFPDTFRVWQLVERFDHYGILAPFSHGEMGLTEEFLEGVEEWQNGRAASHSALSI